MPCVQNSLTCPLLMEDIWQNFHCGWKIYGKTSIANGRFKYLNDRITTMITADMIKNAIADRENQLRIRFEGNIINREIPISSADLRSGVANIITGVRRCGKSTLAILLCGKEKYGYVNFEDERLRGIEAADLNKVIEAVYSLKGADVDVIILDEIQIVKGWESFVSRLAESKKLIVTGSNAGMMSKDLATALTGRHMDNELFPFSFREYLAYMGHKIDKNSAYTTSKKSALMEELHTYMTKGAFPYLYDSKSLKEETFRGSLLLLTLYRDIIERDVVQRYRIKMATKLGDLAKYSISNIGSPISYSNAARLLGLKSAQTALNWMAYLQNSYLLLGLDKHTAKLKDRTIAPKKIYCIDNGIATSIVPELLEQKGRLMENVVAIELYRRNGYGGNRSAIGYWHDYNKSEVDFVVKKGNKVNQLIQVTFASSKAGIKDRETASLIKASEELRCDNLLVITWDYSAEEEFKNKRITFMPLLNWLLHQ